jgi:hypothetical protein
MDVPFVGSLGIVFDRLLGYSSFKAKTASSLEGGLRRVTKESQFV